MPEGADVTTPPEMASEWIAVNTGPLHAAMILDSSDLKYNGIHLHSVEIGRKMNYYISKLDEAHTKSA